MAFGGEVDYEDLLARSHKQMSQMQALSARLASISDLAAALNSVVELDAMLQILRDHTPTLLTYEHCTVVLLHAGQWWLWDLSGAELMQQAVDADRDPAIGYTLQSGSPRLVLNNRDDGLLAAYPSYLVVPIHSANEVIGTINFGAPDLQAFTIEDLRIARLLAFQFGGALQNAERFHELRRIQEALGRNNAELQARNEELDAYNQIIAHDLKAPLNAVYGYASLLALLSAEEFGANGAIYVKQIMDSAHHMNGMIDQLLWLAKAQHTALTLVDLNAVLIRVALRLEHLFVARGVHLDVQPDLPPALGHEAWLEEIFANLLNNAIKYMGDDPDPYVRVRGFVDGPVCRYEVEDNGIGIEEANLKTVFQMFARFSPGEVEGHGLGLSIVARLVHRLGGQVGVSSTAGVGSTFWFTLPASDELSTN
ncbi:MAG: GAF domain-containing sensor histidine kinase [Chloroflexi bacterium]|nr:GAF domain-containing sensor histidine kinase [Chloroflexota bacterium]